MRHALSAIAVARLHAALGRARPWHLVALSLLGSAVLASAMCWVFHGRVLIEYPVTGLVVASVISPLVVGALYAYRWALEDTNANLETRVRERTAALEAARWEADAANQLKSEFLSTISHELNTPLNGALGSLEVLALTGLRPEQAEWVSLAQGSLRELEGLIAAILDLGRLSAGSVPLAREPLDLARAVALAAQRKAPLAAERRLDLRTDIQVAGLFRGDEARLQQVLASLLDNAVKFTERGGIWVEAGETPAGVVVRVRDSGVGIPPERLDRIFDGFTQGDGSHSRRFGGAGTGLATARHLVGRMGGRIEVESALGRGSTFTVHLPLERAA